jgi:peptidoglycan/LPS O-acetylase OafA/YrhL
VLKFFGFISYGLYLVHIFAFYLIDRLLTPQLTNLIASGRPMLATLLRFCAGLALATAIAYLSRTSIEAIFLRIGHGPNTKSSVLLPETVSAIQIDS